MDRRKLMSEIKFAAKSYKSAHNIEIIWFISFRKRTAIGFYDVVKKFR